MESEGDNSHANQEIFQVQSVELSECYVKSSRHSTEFLSTSKKGELEETRRERPKSAPYLRLKNIQGTTIGNIWKVFFQKKVFGKKVAQCRKT